MQMVAQYRQFASDYRRLAAMLTTPADKQALELLAIGWDRIAEKREAMLRSAEPNQCLSPREHQVALLVARGFSNKEVAHELGITDGTVKTHVHKIFQKLGVRNRTAMTHTCGLPLAATNDRVIQLPEVQKFV
jgi:ATP/maltotriose-dependent transcriptional regulator MalT